MFQTVYKTITQTLRITAVLHLRKQLAQYFCKVAKHINMHF